MKDLTKVNTLKRLSSKLCKIFPDKYIIVRMELGRYSTSNKYVKLYKVYIEDTNIFDTYVWSPECKSIEDLVVTVERALSTINKTLLI